MSRPSSQSRTKSSRKHESSALEELRWDCLVLGRYEPKDFGNTWTNRPGDEYPIDIVLGLHKVASIYKVVVDVHEEFVPSEIDFSVGFADLSLPVHYKNAREADFEPPVKMEFRKRQREGARMESRVGYSGTTAQYVWLIVGEPLDYTKNPERLVGIKSITILGYPLSDAELSQMKKDKNRPPTASNSTSTPPHPPPSQSGALRTSSGHDPHNKTHSAPVKPVESNGDGMRTGDGHLGGDPLTALRIVKKVLKQMIEAAKEKSVPEYRFTENITKIIFLYQNETPDLDTKGQDVEATVCLRGVQRLDEYEKMLEDLASRRSAALQANDLQKAEHFRLAMCDCRDTVFRAIHVDLLFNREELRSIGVDSQWSEQA